MKSMLQKELRRKVLHEFGKKSIGISNTFEVLKERRPVKLKHRQQRVTTIL